MSNVTIQQLPGIQPLNGTEVTMMDQSGTTVQASIASLGGFVNSGQGAAFLNPLNLVFSGNDYVSTTNSLSAEMVLVTTNAGAGYALTNIVVPGLSMTVVGPGGIDYAGIPYGLQYINVYLIYNPSTGQIALLGQVQSTAPTNTYTGAYTPAGYTASALVSTVQSTGAISYQFYGFYQQDRTVFCRTNESNNGGAWSTNTGTVWGSLNISSYLPINAKRMFGMLGYYGVSSNMTFQVAANLSGMGAQICNTGYLTEISPVVNFNIAVTTPQTVYILSNSAYNGGGGYTTGYTI